MIRQGGSAGPTEDKKKKKNTHSQNGTRAAAWRVQELVLDPGLGGWLAAALMSGSVTYRAGWMEASESNSFHTYLMLVTVAETLHRVIELMRYLRKCIFFLYKKISHGREGEPLMGSVHTGKSSFFLYCGFLFFFPSETGDRGCSAGRSLQFSPQKGHAAPLTPRAPCPGPRAPGCQAGPLTPQQRQEEGRGRTQPTQDDWNGTPTSLGPSAGGDPVMLQGSPLGWWRDREGWRTGAAPRKRRGGRASPWPGCLLAKAPLSGVVPNPPGSRTGGEPGTAVLSSFLSFPPRFHSFASGPSVLETKSNTALKIRTPNILIAPFGGKVTGTALYHKTLQPSDKATGTFIFRETTEATLEPDVPSGSLPRADILKALGGDKGEQHRQQARRETLGPDRVAVPGTRSSPGSQRLHLPRPGWPHAGARDREEVSGDIPRRERLAEGGAGRRLRLEPADPRPSSEVGTKFPKPAIWKSAYERQKQFF